MPIDSAMTPEINHNPMAVWCLTENGLRLAARIAARNAGTHCFVSRRLSESSGAGACFVFQRLTSAVERHFHRYREHVFIMAAGIAVRTVAPLIRHKTIDPAVVVVDDAGRFAVSLLSGHLGGANDLAQNVARCLGALPVITTATDVNGLPAIDVLAAQLDLIIENPEAIKHVNMAILNRASIRLHDPRNTLQDHFPEHRRWWRPVDLNHDPVRTGPAGVFIDDIQVDLPPQFLILRPPTLAAGIGCNRATAAAEIEALLMRVLAENRLSLLSVARLASISIKKDEKGLLELAERLKLPVRFFEKDQLAEAEGIQNPSATVAKYTGVQSVCEAAAILAAGRGTLIVPKQTTRNVTVAVARMPFTSSASVPAGWNTCPGGPAKC